MDSSLSLLIDCHYIAHIFQKNNDPLYIVLTHILHHSKTCNYNSYTILNSSDMVKYFWEVTGFLTLIFVKDKFFIKKYHFKINIVPSSMSTTIGVTL